jgi:hypothetical protein
MGEDEDDAGQRFLSPCCNSLKGNLGYALEGTMRKLVRCKACGFIMQENELREKCPACGAPKTVFEPYTDTVGEKRRRLLDMDLHPMMVHFPTSFIVVILLLSIGLTFITGPAADLMSCTNKLLVLFLPLVVLLSFIIGIVDGKTRFRHIKNSQILMYKTMSGSVFLALSFVLTAAIWFGNFTNPFTSWVTISLSIVCLACAIILGLLGKRIINAAFPGE